MKSRESCSLAGGGFQGTVKSKLAEIYISAEAADSPQTPNVLGLIWKVLGKARE